MPPFEQFYRKTGSVHFWTGTQFQCRHIQVSQGRGICGKRDLCGFLLRGFNQLAAALPPLPTAKAGAPSFSASTNSLRKEKGMCGKNLCGFFLRDFDRHAKKIHIYKLSNNIRFSHEVPKIICFVINGCILFWHMGKNFCKIQRNR